MAVIGALKTEMQPRDRESSSESDQEDQSGTVEPTSETDQEDHSVTGEP